MPRALLTDIESRKREAVDVNLSEQGVEGLTGEISAHQACADQLKITAKFGDRPVMEGFARLTFGSKRLGALSRSSPSGIGQLIISQLGETQPFEHEAHLQAVGLEAVAGGSLLVDLREAKPIHFQ